MPPKLAENSGLNHFTKKFGDNGVKLVSIRHSEKGVWAKHYHLGVDGYAIPRESILQEYKERALDSKRRRETAES